MKPEDKVLTEIAYLKTYLDWLIFSLRESYDHQSKDLVDDFKIDFHVFFFSSLISFVIFDQFPRQNPTATT